MSEKKPDSDKEADRHFDNSDDQRMFHEGKRIRAAVIHDVIMAEGNEELRRSLPALGWSGLAAGISISLSMVMMAILQAHLDPDWGGRHLIASMGYTAGFIVVILARQQLFTENTITALLPVFTDWTLKTALCMLRLWLIVFVANILGASIFSWIAANSPLFPDIYRDAFLSIGQHILHYSFSEMLIKGALAGWLIATLVWILPAIGSQKILAIFAITWIIGAAQLTHIVAGTTETTFVYFMGQTDLWSVVGHFMVPTFIGNVIGGSLLFALISHAQVRGESPSIRSGNGKGSKND